MAVVVPYSTFLDSFANQQATSAQFTTLGQSTNSLANAQAVLGPLFAVDGSNASVAAAAQADTITLGLVLNRANDPSALLASPWAVRAAALADQTAIWNTYGAVQTTYDATVADIATTVGSASPQATATNAGYLSSAADRTIWLTLDATQFQALFGTPLLIVTPKDAGAFPAWSGNLSLPDTIAPNVGGVWLEEGIRILDPATMNTAEVDPSPLQDGYLGIGNGFLQSDTTPAAVAANYSFPLSTGQSLPTDPIALIEANLPLSTEPTLFANYNQYRQALGLPELTADQFNVLRMQQAGDPSWSAGSEFALDISVIAGGAPASSLLLYTYLTGSNTTSTAFNAYQRAFFDSNNASVLSSSYPVGSQPTANSPFQWAWQQLFVDGALNNVSTQVSAGDQGSSGNIANGLANVPNSQASPMALVVGGTSIADLYAAQEDVTLQQMAQSALQGDPATIFSLVASGLTTLPSSLSSSAPTKPQTVLASMFETVWQRLQLTPFTFEGNTVYASDFGANSTGLGGAANGVPIPDYQSAFGLSLLTGDSRGTPDVAALAGGDNRYAVLNSDYGESGEALITADGGTSAATPLWASLTAQINAVFKDQGLPQLGYYNDLLYMAAVIMPASFNDILLGNNIDSFYSSLAPTGYFNTNAPESFMVPTGEGATAGSGYDLATGLGTPNGTLLARALTLIAHSQTSFSDEPSVIDSDGTGGWTSGADQSLLFQTSSSAAVNVRLFTGSDSQTYTSTASSPYAWTSRLAEQSLQPDFDPALVRMFDKQSQGALTQSQTAIDDTIGVNINAASTDATQATLSTSFGFADFDSSTSDSSVRVARPVMVAETAGGADDQDAVIRIRQNGQDSLSVEFYRVDDMNGKIDGLSPGDAGYAAAAAARAYSTTSGSPLINGPGYGNYTQTELTGVDAGDFVAMTLFNNTHGDTYWEFSQANETVGGQSIAHIWNYGANTWGWEDTRGGGDRDYNDLVIGVDFTSASGSGVLVG